MQQGGSPSPFDRNMGTKMAAKCVEWLVEQCKKNTQPDGTIRAEDAASACLLGIVRRQYRFTPLADLISETNFEYINNNILQLVLRIMIIYSRQRIPKKQWWLKLRPLLRILAKHDSAYEEEGMYITVEEECASDAAII